MNRRDERRGRRDPRDAYAAYSNYSNAASVTQNTGTTYFSGEPTRFKSVDGAQLDTIIVGHLTSEQITAYQNYFRVEEISEMFRRAIKNQTDVLSLLPSGNISAHKNLKRDPSPPPKYDSSGNRTNTRAIRVNEALDRERHKLVELAARSIKNYEPPLDYQKPVKTFEKLYIPIKDYPDINFVGQLLGPRGNTLRQLQEGSGAKLAIRGKGSVKDGKSTAGVSSNSEMNSNDDDLHVVITADSQQKIAKAIQLTNEIIERAISSPVGQNDLKRGQLRELAILNGTLRETKPFVPRDGFRRPTFEISKIVCKICGNIGHLARDCKMRDRNVSYDANEEQNDDQTQEDIPRYEASEPVEPPWKKQQIVPPWQAQNAPTSAPPAAIPPASVPPQGSLAPPPGPVPAKKPPPPSSKPAPPPTTKPAPPPTTKPAPPPTTKPAPPPKPTPPARPPPPS